MATQINSLHLADIAVGVDGTPESFAALTWAMREAVITGQTVNAVYGWTHSWDMGDKPVTDDEWARIRKLIRIELKQWAQEAGRGIDFDFDNKLELTSVHAAGTTALLNIGTNAHQLVVGRRSMSRAARWFFGSTSTSLIEKAQLPVTIVHEDSMNPGESSEVAVSALRSSLLRDAQRQASNTTSISVHTSNNGSTETITETEVTETIYDSSSLRQQSSQQTVNNASADIVTEETILGEKLLPIVVGVDGSQSSIRALEFAIEVAQATHRHLYVIYCWSMRRLAEETAQEHGVISQEEGQAHAEKFVQRIVSQADIPDFVPVRVHAYHMPPAKGLIMASQYANRLVIGTRRLQGLDATLGSVSRKVIDDTQCTVTIVH